MPATHIQTLIFSNAEFSKEQAMKWAKDHQMKAGVDETGDSFRLRQKDPGNFDPNSFRTIELTKGIKAVVGHLKGG